MSILNRQDGEEEERVTDSSFEIREKETKNTIVDTAGKILS